MIHDQTIADGNFRMAFEYVARVRNWLLQANDLRGEKLDKALAERIASLTMDAIGAAKKPHPWLRNDAVPIKRGRPPKSAAEITEASKV